MARDFPIESGRPTHTFGFWGDPVTSGMMRLPNLGVGIGYSLRLHDLGEGCHDIDICHVMRFDDRWNIRMGSLDPDVEVGFTFDDFASGRDPVMNYVMRLVREGNDPRGIEIPLVNPGPAAPPTSRRRSRCPG